MNGTSVIRPSIKLKKDLAIVHKLCKEYYGFNKTLSKKLDKHLIPGADEKDSRGEITTPHALRWEMLNTMPKSFWRTPQTVLEPCCGKGGFIIDIFRKFDMGLRATIPDKTERHRIIIEKCIYFIDTNPENVEICTAILRGLYGTDTPIQCNGVVQDALKLNAVHVWGITKFGAIITNPPYAYKEAYASPIPIYHHFVDRFINECRFLLFVIPSRWFQGGRPAIARWREAMMARRDLRVLYHQDSASKWFGNIIELKGGVCYFLKDADYAGDCLLNDTRYDLRQFDRIYRPQDMPYVQFIQPWIAKYGSLSDICMGRCYGIETNDERLSDTPETDAHIPCWVSSKSAVNEETNGVQNGRIKYIPYEFCVAGLPCLRKGDTGDVCTDIRHQQQWKVIIPRAATGTYGGWPEFMTVAKPDAVHTGSYLSFRVKNAVEGANLIAYLRCPFIENLLCMRKPTHDMSLDTFGLIPLLPLTRNWTADAIYETLNVPPELQI